MCQIDQLKQKKAKKYFFENFFLSQASGILTAVFLILLLNSSFQSLAENFFASVSPPFFLRSLYLLILLFLIHLLSFFFSWAAGFKTEKKYGFSNQTFTGWFKDYVKAFLLSVAIGLIVVNVFYLLTEIFPSLWWLGTALFLFIFSAFLQRIAPALIIPIFYRLHPLEDQNLKQDLTHMAEKAGFRLLGIYKIFLGDKTKKANAAVTGLGKTKKMLLGDTLTEKYDREEIKAVMAHELSHSVRGHIFKLLFTDALFTLLSLYLLFRLFPLISDFLNIRGVQSIYSLPALILILGVVNFLFRPFKLYISRSFEKEADNDALNLSGRPEKFISLLTSFANDYLSYADPPEIIKIFSYSHPPLKERIRNAKKFKEKKSFT